MDETRRGLAYGLTAYAIWGFFPLYIRLLRPAGAVEILAHRVVWSVAFVAVLLTVARGWSFLRSLRGQRRRAAGIVLAAVLIGINWGGYIYGVNSERVVETALGYFITPLVVVLLGVVALRERLRVAQWVALGVGALAVVVLTVDYGRLPYIALTLAASFGTYSLVKKNLALPASGGLFVESAVLALPALAYLAWLTASGDSTFGTEGAGHLALMVVSGAATAIPLILFAGAANRLPLTAVGILQYVAPILQLAVGLFVFHEPMPPARLAGFALVWIALIVFTVDGIRASRAARRAAVPATAATAA
ncbi:EamA family transporter RarD [Catenuloplanes atrovinosus]|uniref:Chloramphenicol-sensitive protein RarD n=1 Tax=Catenuloplanes atrovinosus TaxID=137266 RepID=A0AAE4CCJ1_9ACTN|nr:EamA family transporter RarD [Catenuloplanes atrovinosus]MDR7279686.1 chloramphenicol-sensitive protein RarD [Catenuloplanes atrovinosus]